MNKHPSIILADQARERFGNMISELATLRMEEARVWFVKTFPTWKLKVIFGMGGEHIALGDDSRRCDFARINEHGPPGVQVTTRNEGGFTFHCVIEVAPPKDYPEHAERFSRPYYCLQPLAEAIADVIDITNGYSDGCPEDIEV